jgi:poly(3-hydroxybutyrate) depolymerase
MRTITTGGQSAPYIVNLPAGYDPNTPQPLGFAFNGFSRTYTQCANEGDCPGFKELKAVTVFPESFGQGWETPASGLAANIQLFLDLLALVKNEYCVDENRIFIAGVSSGGQFVEHIACRFGDQLWASVPIAAYVDNGVNANCKGAPPQLIVHGATDRASARSEYGRLVAELYANRNGCAALSASDMAQARADMVTAFNARQEMVRCLDAASCTSNPVRYCIFSQMTYGGLTHGWPRSAGRLMTEFFSTLR